MGDAPVIASNQMYQRDNSSHDYQQMERQVLKLKRLVKVFQGMSVSEDGFEPGVRMVIPPLLYLTKLYFLKSDSENPWYTKNGQSNTTRPLKNRGRSDMHYP